MNNKGIIIFKHEQFGEIRTMQDEKGEPWFVGKDVAKVLGYKKTENALMVHVDNEDKTTTLIQGTGSNYKSKAVIINESGLYSLVLSSKLPQAKAFKRWVTSEVLPQIRKTGGYIPTHDVRGKQMTEQEVIQCANRILKRTITQKNFPSDNCLSATEVAKRLGIDVKSLNQMLVDRGIIKWTGGRYRLTRKYEGQGFSQDPEIYCRKEAFIHVPFMFYIGNTNPINIIANIISITVILILFLLNIFNIFSFIPTNLTSIK